MKGSELGGGIATSMGSLPHTDPAAATAFELRHHPHLPAAPSLPARSPAEGMIAQAAWGVPGVAVDTAAGGRRVVDRSRLDPDAPVAPAVRDEPFEGLRVFLSAVAHRRERVKLQLTGPLTLGMALVAAGAPQDLAYEVAAGAVRARARELVWAARSAAPGVPLVVFLDEPGLTALPGDGFPLATDQVIDLVSGCLAVLEPHAVTGLHCCGPTDWRAVLEMGADVLSLPVDAGIEGAAGALGSHLERGGAVAWGAVSTSGPVGAGVDRPWRRLTALWCDLVRAGCDPVLLRTRCLVTPECGLALHDFAQADRILRLTSRLADRVGDQAVATRISIGA